MTRDDEANEPRPLFAPVSQGGGYGCCPSCLVNIMALLERHDEKVAMGTALSVLANVLHQQVPPHERDEFLTLLPTALRVLLAKVDAAEASGYPTVGHA